MEALQNVGVFLVQTLFSLYIGAVLIRFLLALSRANFYNPLSQFLVKITNPVLVPLRRLIPAIGKLDTAAIVLAHAVGMTHCDLMDLRARLAAGLNGEGDWPTDWPELVHLAPAHAYPARHPAILLPYDALIAAIEGFG